MSKVDVMQIFGQSANSHNSSVGDVLALCKDKISESWCRWNDASNSIVADMFACSEI